MTTSAHHLPFLHRADRISGFEGALEAHVAEQERRKSNRFDKAFTVYLSSSEGLGRGVARNISEGGMFVETRGTFPLGSRIWVTFVDDGTGSEMSAEAEVRYQCFLNYAGPPGANSVRGMGLRFLQFESRQGDLGVLGAREAVMQ